MLKGLLAKLSKINVGPYMPYIMDALKALAKYFGYNVSVSKDGTKDEQAK